MRVCVSGIALVLAACNAPPPVSHEPPASVEHPVPESELARVRLTDAARERLGVTTGAVVAHRGAARRQMAGGGTLLAFDFKGGKEAAFRFLNRLEIADISNNLGDVKSLACHPATTTHRALSPEERASMGLDESWVRFSVGLEDADDLMEDVLYALDEANKA